MFNDILYSAQFSAVTDSVTIVNLCNHAYWNLSGHDSGESILRHTLHLPLADRYTCDDELIPTGELASVIGTVFDFYSTPACLGEKMGWLRDDRKTGGGYDLCYVNSINETDRALVSFYNL